MARFVAHHESTLPVADAWARLTDWPSHAQFVPFTTIRVSPPGPSAVGTVFTAYTGVGRFGFDDPMEIVDWVEPTDGRGGACRLVKRGEVMLGWAELSVEPTPLGSRATWTEEITVAKLPRGFEPLTAVSSRLLFTRVLRRLLT